MSKIVIYGSSGFLGTALVGRLVSMGKTNIVAVARNEGGLVYLKEKYPSVEIIVGDIANKWIVKKSMQDATEVYLLSAMKHVGLSEQQVFSCVNTNIVGTMNVVEESIHVKPYTFVFVSSDKAAQPMGVYGCTKKIGEKLIQEAERINEETDYRIVRYGNVAWSTGSILNKWKAKMLKGEEVIITDPEATRFFWTVDEAVDLIFQSISDYDDATPVVPKMKAVAMRTVIEACMEFYGLSPVKTIGLQPGENKVETTDGITFSDTCDQYSKEEFKTKFLR